MNIGLLSTYFSLATDADSGIGQHYRVLADALDAQGHRVHVVYPTQMAESARSALSALSPRWTCDVVPVQLPAWLNPVIRGSWTSRVLLGHLWAARAADRALAGACHAHNLEIVETHAYEAPALFFLRRRRRPKVLTRVSTTMAQMIAISSIHSRVQRWQAALERHVTRQSDALVTHASSHRDAVCALEGYDANRFAIIPHGLPDPGEPTAEEVSPRDDTIEFLFVGRFESRKGIDVLLAAIPAVAATCPQAVFLLAGAPGEGRDWDDFATRHPHLAGSRVKSLGRVPQATLRDLYRHCTVFVAPSRYESFGLIYVEAMSHGKPVIGCAVGGIPEVVTDGVTGLLAGPGDVQTLTACMIKLARDPALRTRFGAAGRKDFLARFSAATMASRSVELYRQIADVDLGAQPA